MFTWATIAKRHPEWFYHEKIRESSLCLSLTGDSTETQRLRFLLSHLSHISNLATFGCSETSSHNLLLSIRRIDLIPSYHRSVEGTSGSNLGNLGTSLGCGVSTSEPFSLLIAIPAFAVHSIVLSISTFQPVDGLVRILVLFHSARNVSVIHCTHISLFASAIVLGSV